MSLSSRQQRGCSRSMHSLFSSLPPGLHSFLFSNLAAMFLFSFYSLETSIPQLLQICTTNLF
jgi:hypothetical protein